MKAVKLKGTSEGLYLITDMSYDKRKVEEDLIEIVKGSRNNFGSFREVFCLLKILHKRMMTGFWRIF